MQVQPDDQEDADGRATALDLDLVELVVITTPSLTQVSGVAGALQEHVTSSHLRVLDLVGVETDAVGRYSVVELDQLSGFSGVQVDETEVGGLLSEDDIALACSALAPGTVALVLVVEHRWARSLAEAARAGGGRISGGERIPRYRLEQSKVSRARLRHEAGG